MGKRVKAKCKVTGRIDYTDNMFKIETDSGNRYYLSEELWELEESWRAYRLKTLGLFATQIMDYNNNQHLDSYMLKQFKDLNVDDSGIIESKYPFEVIYGCLKQNMKYIKQSLAKVNFTSERGKAKYAIVILESNLSDYYKIWQKKKIECQKMLEAIKKDNDNRKMIEVKHTNRNDISDLIEEIERGDYDVE